MRPATECLRLCPALAGLPRAIVAELAAAAVQFSLSAGSLLFEAGAAADGVYLLTSGRLGVRMPGQTHWVTEIETDELVGESGWLLAEPRSASVLALRDSELLLLPAAALTAATQHCAELALALARLSARRLRRSNRRESRRRSARVFVIVPNNEEVAVAELATQLVAELTQFGPAELVWDVRASEHTLAWFNRIEEQNEHVVYVADPGESAWTRQCCRQADVILIAGRARSDPRPWTASIAHTAVARGARVELALLHDGDFAPGTATRWLGSLPGTSHHHIVDGADLARVARLLTRRGVGLVLSGGGARGFAHLGIVRALREARIPIDFVGGASIGGIIAAGIAMGWSDAEMQTRYRRGFVDSNPLNDYTFPRVALTRGRKVSRLLHREYGDVLIEDLRRPFFCVSSSLTTGCVVEHRAGRVAEALRASVAIPGVMPPVRCGDDVLVDGAAINNLPVELMQRHAPGLVIGSDVGADRTHDPGQHGNIFQILMRAGMVNSAASAAAQRLLADVLLRPPLPGIDLLNWRAFDRAIDLGYAYAVTALGERPDIPRLAPVEPPPGRVSSLQLELAARLLRDAAG